MKALVRVLKTVGDTFVKVYLASLMISAVGDRSDVNTRYR